ncbi:hypothetical protein FNV43_RR07886 [Rhamnella rubrinervis]|uniref:Bifunctional inhibitor/plant lipid transfer protein/seed storage helical domain-containing protein n=1 Tax=Rhamnella rubrinervis TaxID=2594499 RepID=A0A8K0MNE9_9ROSA|nr:hypothetical protein FNV43_RR07886 [Rhamnella rubrinervis]
MEKKMMAWSAMLLGLGLAVMVLASPAVPKPAAEPAPDITELAAEPQPPAVPKPAAEPAPDITELAAEPQPPAEPAAEPQPPAEPAPPTDDITCQQAAIDLLPCQPFLTARAGADKPTVPCCVGVKTVFQQANTTQNRRDLCECFKRGAAQIGVKPERAKQIPDLCSIAIKIPIDPSVDCSK